jgi:transcriptional regulator with XRE-family HTH domain
MSYQPNPIAHNIRLFRERLGFSQQQVAVFLGLSRALVSYYENGEREPSLEVLEKLADLFQIELYDLVTEDAAEQATNMAFAFRAEDFENQDITAITDFGKIVKSYLKMKKLMIDVAK